MDNTLQKNTQILKQDKEKEKVLSIIKCCISTAKELTIDQLQYDYKQLEGSTIPFSKFQHPSLASFLHSVPQDVKLMNRGGQIFVKSAGSNVSSHLENLVKGQMKSKARGNYSKPNMMMRRPRSTSWAPRNNTSRRPYSSIRSKPPLLPSPALLPRQARPTNAFRKPPIIRDSLPRQPYAPLPNATRPKAPSNVSSSVITQQPPKSTFKLPQGPRPILKKTNTSTSYITQLEEEARKNKPALEVVFKTIPCGKKNNYWLSIVKVGEQKFSSFPAEKSTPAEASEEAAKNALEAIRTSEPQNDYCWPETKDFDLATRRVKEILTDKSIWWQHVRECYSKIYKETVSPSWIQEADKKKIKGFNIIQPIVGQWILSLENPSQVSAAEETVNEKQRIPRKPRKLQLPEDKMWNVLVTDIKDSSEIWFRLIGEEYNDAYENLVTDMELFYLDAKNLKSLKNPSVGEYYACSHVDSWFRIQLINIEEKFATVFFADHGDEEVIPLTNLFELHPEFLELPTQAIKSCLHGFEYGFPFDRRVLSEAHNLAVSQSLVAEIVNEEPLSVILFDTSTSDDININEILLEMLPQSYPAPSLPSEGGVCEVYLSHVTSSGDIYVRIESASYQILQNLLVTAKTRAAEILGEDDVRIDLGKLYLAKFNGEWERAAPRNANRDAEGKSLHCVLYNVPSSPSLQWTEKASQELVSHFSDQNEPMLLKVIKESTAEEPAQVELFQRIETQNTLVSINATLDVNFSIFSNEEMNNNLKTEESALASPQYSKAGNERACSPYSEVVFVMALQPLIARDLPELNNYFDVFVTYAASPSHFAVQSLKNNDKLVRLMNKMGSFYSDESKLKPVSKIHEGGFYALLHTDASWYRVIIYQSRGDLASGAFVDYGDAFCSTTDKIQELWPDFKQLPYQSFKASLGGILPLNKDWTPEDSCRFKELVDNQPFVSIVMRINPEDRQEQPTLVLCLIDTKSPDDIYIDQILIEEGRARRAPQLSEGGDF